MAETKGDIIDPYKELYPDRRVRYVKRHIALGLCKHCSEPAEPGKKVCKKHLESQRLYSERRLKYREDNGLCKFCGLPLIDIDSGFKYHSRDMCSPSRRAV